MAGKPFIVGLGGTPRAGSTSELALRNCLAFAEEFGAETQMLTARDLDLPMYGVGVGGDERGEAAKRLVAALRRCDGLVVSSPCYHGSLSGLLKNELDYVEDLRDESAPYLDGRAVGCIAIAYGPQAMGTTLLAMRTIVHALRAWPTPMAAALNGASGLFDAAGRCIDDSAEAQLRTVARQVTDFATMRRLVARSGDRVAASA
jgi:FMN reductase